ncbi:MAG: aconitate hydratase AcnA [Actinobacteria bacterium]|uniref:(2R,3S)-2-methylisocitrate dehydratase n=1 Tax=freshwater metagenome TaxID=449393 RepID=A0A6J5ZE46_9ZZZZ|nr:aconitate hydratase AcnA [Actinomycetota bacterium]
MSSNSFNARRSMSINGQDFEIFSLKALSSSSRLPFTHKVLLENLLRTEDGANVTAEQISALANWDATSEPTDEIQFTPARVIMQDFTGVPCIVDLATMREAFTQLGGDPKRINPLAPAELVIDHSVIADFFGDNLAAEKNVELEYKRNGERYQFLRWGQDAFDDFKVVPPGTGIVHQVNIEALARVVMLRNGQAYPDTCVGTDSHTTMVNGLGVLGWGVGGIEAEAAMLGQPVSMLIPRVVGFKLNGSLKPGTTATDLVLTITAILRKHGVVGKFVEFYGEGVGQVSLANRATIGNMSPEYGSTAAVFPIDDETLAYLKLTGRSQSHIDLVQAYAREQGLWHDTDNEPTYSEYLELDLDTVEPSIAGPKRPQDRISLDQAASAFAQALPTYTQSPDAKASAVVAGTNVEIGHGAVVIAAITSCTNTSNPSVMLAAGLVAKKAVEKGLSSAPWVKTTLAPGSQVVTDYYNKSGLTTYLDQLGFNLVGYGCTTCIGNSGPIDSALSDAIGTADLAVTAVLSGNRNFEGRINPDVKMNYLASPPLVVAYAIAGSMDIDITTEPLGIGSDGQNVYLRDIWPTPQEIAQAVSTSIDAEMFTSRYANVFEGDKRWRNLPTPQGDTFDWDEQSTYVRKPPYFEDMSASASEVTDIHDARVLAKLGDSVTTDHISPAGSIRVDTPAGKYLTEHGIDKSDFNSYGSRRGNHEVMIRGTFANIRLRNQLLNDVEGGFTRDFTQPDAPQAFIYDAAMNAKSRSIPMVILAGKEYGSGSSRDWAAKGTALLGVRAVIAESYERIHRSNLLGMGVLPLQFPTGTSAQSLGLTGTEVYNFTGVTALNDGVIPATVRVTALGDSGVVEFDAVVRIDTPGEADYYRHGGILQYVLRSLLSK